MLLLERDDAIDALGGALDRCAGPGGGLVAVTGEMGIGKTALLRAFAVLAAEHRPVLVTGCDDLLTPRPLAPLHDLDRMLSPHLQELLATGASSTELFAAFAVELRAPLRRAVLVVEDLQWADDATLDWLSYLARRLEDLPVLVVLTFRDDDPHTVTALTRVLAAADRDRVTRIRLEPLSAEAIADLVGKSGEVDRAERVMALTGGNPLFATELADATDDILPPTIQETVLHRTTDLSDEARAVLETVAAVPGRAEWALLEAAVPDWPSGAEDAIASGLVVDDEDGLHFRHEVIRRVVEDTMSALRRRSTHDRVLQALQDLPGIDPARLAHHARRSGRRDDILRWTTAAARAAAAAGAHRQAYDQYRAAVESADVLPPVEQAQLLAAFAQEARICNQLEDAVDAHARALQLWTDGTDPASAGAGIASLARLHWLAGDRHAAEQAARRAIAELDPFGPSAALSMACGCLADILMAVGEHEEAARWSQRAVDLAHELGDEATLAATLSDTGSGTLFIDHDRGERLLIEAFDLAGDEHPDIAGRAASTLAMGCLYQRRYDDAGQRLDQAMAWARDHDLYAHEMLVLGLRSRWNLDLGRWDEAEADARTMLGGGDQPGVSLCPALVTLGLLHARRGDPEAGEVLDDAWERALHTGDLQRIAPTAAARAELAWLADDLDGVVRAATPGFELAVAVGEPWSSGELGWWLCVAGQRPDLAEVAEPFRHLCGGDWRSAADAWGRRGLPYERALALSTAPEPEPVLEALAAVDGLGAVATGRVIRRRLRDLGVRSIPRGPRRTTQAHPAGLTARQQDVLELVAAGRTNKEIADELVVSIRTVDHHVSAILAKLEVSSREEAAAWHAATTTPA